MNRTYLYPRFNLLLLIVSGPLVILCAIVARGYFAQALGETNLLPRLISATIGLFFTSISVWIVAVQIVNLAGVRRVITVQNLFSRKTIRWENITEFGTYTIGFQHPLRRFYLKTKEHGDEKIDVCTRYLANLKDLIDTIFLKAVNGNFVVLANRAWIPFTKRLQLVPWDRNDHRFL
jgi:hypothetical protein